MFLAPKVYGLITEDGKEIIKVKGLTPSALSGFKFTDLEALLIQDSSREFTPEKWNKQLLEGTITINDQLYTLKATSNKRQQIYTNKIFDNTKPYNYDNIIKK